jgi:hypothetical protein
MEGFTYNLDNMFIFDKLMSILIDLLSMNGLIITRTCIGDEYIIPIMTKLCGEVSVTQI